ncbi:hypothetical protein HELRODRAFT_78521, partial [Helobdella robusta]|uniref:Peptidase M14 domain-containing protein n=1 Tax=Helobdella robusta TaxID=6412 RepID=T1G3C6_HELRO
FIHAQIESWLNIMVRLFPEVVSVKHYGRSYENRTLTYAKIGLGNWNKPIIFIESGVHAREWGSVTSALHIIKKLLIGYRKNEERLVHLLRRFDFYVIPVCNPDGYDYTFGPDFLHRVWRKTRSKTTAENCVGVDMNRNFYRAKGDKHGVYSMNQCMEDYPGKRPASEVETTHLIRLLNSIRHRVKGYYSVHTFGQLWFIPYAYSNNLYPVFEDMVSRLVGWLFRWMVGCLLA